MATIATTPIEKKASNTLLWVLLLGVVFIIGALALVMPNNPDLVAGFSTHQILTIELILFVSGLMSGLSGFGFSAVGAACLLLIPPIVEAPLLQSLSTANQLLSVEQLKDDMPRTWKGFWAGPGFCILGGLPGAFVGIWMLSHLPAKQLTTGFGSLLVLYSLYSMFKPTGAKINGFDGPITGAIVGFIGGALGGFTAFPGAAVVVWTGLRDLPKKQNRSIVQPYIIMSQIFALILIKFLHPQYLSHKLWLLLLVTLPAVLPGTFGGVMLYRRISDVNFRRVSFILLGLSGLALLIRNFGPALIKLF
jgi:uncharacterized membrane protein YfcA